MKNTKAVYEHISKETNKVIYVGAGEQKKRPYDMYARSQEHLDIINSCGVIVNIVQDGLTIKQAMKLEIKTIKKYGIENLLNKKVASTGFESPTKEQIEKLIKTRQLRGHNDNRCEKYPKSKAHSDSLRKISDKDIQDIIKETTQRLLNGERAIDVDIDLGERYGLNNRTIGKVRARTGRYSKFPHTIKREGRKWVMLQEGELPKKNKSFKRKRKMVRLTSKEIKAKYGLKVNKPLTQEQIDYRNEINKSFGRKVA